MLIRIKVNPVIKVAASTAAEMIIPANEAQGTLSQSQDSSRRIHVSTQRGIATWYDDADVGTGHRQAPADSGDGGGGVVVGGGGAPPVAIVDCGWGVTVGWVMLMLYVMEEELSMFRLRMLRCEFWS